MSGIKREIDTLQERADRGDREAIKLLTEAGLWREEEAYDYDEPADLEMENYEDYSDEFPPYDAPAGDDHY